MTPPVLNNYSAGEFQSSKKQFEDLNPVDGSLVAMVAEADREMVDKAVRSGREALDGEWGSASIAQRAEVPLQDTDEACKELSRAMKDGHLGVQIGNHVGDRDLDDERIITFLQHCADEGAAVLIHPWDMLGGEKTAKYMMAWTVSMPAETQLGIVSMILGGAFDRLPAHSRVCFAHGGGSFAFLLGRLENAWHRRDIVRGKWQHPPSEYLGKFYVDSAVFDTAALRFLVEVCGEDKVMLGSDYPFPLGEEFVGKLIRSADVFDDATRAKLLGGNAIGFLGLEESQAKTA